MKRKIGEVLFAWLIVNLGIIMFSCKTTATIALWMFVGNTLSALITVLIIFIWGDD